MKRTIQVLLITFACFLCNNPLLSQNLVINELLARNANGHVDELGDDDDWIEIHNYGSSSINIAGLYISDTNSIADFYRIPSYDASKTTIPAGGYIILWADGEPAEGPNHMPFKLSNTGEGVFLGELSGGSIDIIDEVVFPKLERDVSYGRWPNRTGDFILLSDPSPGAANIAVRQTDGIIINEVMAINNGPDVDKDGEAEDWIELYNTSNHSIDVGGLYFTDSIGELTMHRIPIHQPDSTTIPAGGYLRFWCDAEPTTSVWHIDFRLGRGGEKVTMTQPDGKTIIQEVRYPSASADASFGQYPDDSGNWIYLNIPTPNSPNDYNYTSIDGVVINEFMANNESVYPDNLGQIEDWIELYNSNNYAVNVGGLIFTDSLNIPLRYRIPETQPDSTTIPAKGYLVFWADNQPEQGVLHLDIKLSGFGESIGLYQYRSSLVELDSYTFGSQLPNITEGRSPDGSSTWLTLSEPSPGSSNGSGSSPIITGLYINEFVARNSTGYPDEFGNIVDWIELYNSTNSAIDIGGLYFSDVADNLKLSQIPLNQSEKTTVPAKGYLIVWPDRKPELGALHLDFQLAGAGETFGIYQEYDGQMHTIQSKTYPQQTSDISYGRAPDGSFYWHFFSQPTPMAPNPATGVDVIPNQTALQIFPNPGAKEMSIYIEGISSNQTYVQILSIDGKEVWSNSFQMSGAGEMLELSNHDLEGKLGPGIFFLRIQAGKDQYLRKLIRY